MEKNIIEGFTNEAINKLQNVAKLLVILKFLTIIIINNKLKYPQKPLFAK